VGVFGDDPYEVDRTMGGGSCPAGGDRSGRSEAPIAERLDCDVIVT